MCSDSAFVDSAPDGGWGWLVVFGSFCCMMVVDGISLSYGLLISPTCPSQSLQALDTKYLHAPSSHSLSSYDLGIVWSAKVREISLPTGSCLGHSEMGEALNTQSRTQLMLPGGFLVGIYLLLGSCLLKLTITSCLSRCLNSSPNALVLWNGRHWSVPTDYQPYTACP